MNEEKRWPVPVRNMRVLPKTNDMEYIPIRSDSTRRVHVSSMPQTVSVVQNVHKRIEQQISLSEVMEKVTPWVALAANLAMAGLLIRMSHGVIW